MTVAAGLVGDIGGTHARFALVEKGPHGPFIGEPKTYDNCDYPSPEAAIDAYFAEVREPRPPSVVLAVAGPVTDGAIDFTNSDWELSETGLRKTAGFASARLINDFVAQSLGAPHVKPDHLRRVGPEVHGVKGATLATLGPGTGFGVSALARNNGSETPLATEGGHVGFAPTDELEVEIWRWLVKRHGRVSIERILSGPGLHELYQAMAEIDGAPAVYTDAQKVQAAAEAGDALAAKVIDRFCLILGSTAGDIALGLGARGGVYVTGGVAVALVQHIAAGGFRERFEAKGRFHDYLAAIPTFVMLEPYTALIGAASLIGEAASA